MSRLRIEHETTYRYLAAVQFGAHRLVLRPREGHDLRVLEMCLAIEPRCEVVWSRDLFGNSVATAHFREPGEVLRIHNSVLVEQTARFPIEPRVPARVAFPVVFPAFELPVASAYLASSYPDDSERVREWAGTRAPVGSGAGAEEVVAAVAKAVRDEIQYRRREEPGVQTPAQTIDLRSGSCRDLATLMLEALRALGLPARFASGYLDCTASEAGRASTHAWAEAYLPQVGWTGFDPTLGEPTTVKHVVTGVSHHPRGVMPVSGTYFGDRGLYAGMTVTVRTERVSEPKNAEDSEKESGPVPQS